MEVLLRQQALKPKSDIHGKLLSGPSARSSLAKTWYRGDLLALGSVFLHQRVFLGYTCELAQDFFRQG